MSTVVYDKVKWHFPDGKDCPDLESATRHFKVIIKWLNAHGFLSEYGKEVIALPIGEDFSITSDMLTPEGNHLLSQYYDEWIKTLDYSKDPSPEFWDTKKNEP